MEPKLIIVLGPTASGKSDLAIALAQQFNGEIVNADSRQIYRGMTIGTASPTQYSAFSIYNSAFTIQGIPHHLFHFAEPDAYFSVAEYKKRALAAVRDIHQRNKVPFLVGGTGLYIWAVADNLMIPEVPPNAGLRAALKSESIENLLKRLGEKDPEAIQLTDKNKRRIIRALEVISATDKKFTDARKPGEPLFVVFQIGLSVPLDRLDSRIEKRAKQMIRDGLIEEVRDLLRKYPPGLPAFDSPGYREFTDYFNGNLTLTEATERFIHAHKQLARQQIKWFKRDQRIQWFRSDEKAQIKKVIGLFLKHKSAPQKRRVAHHH